MRILNKYTITFAVAVVLISVPLWYFTMWRTSDDAYASAITNVNTMLEDVNTISDTLSSAANVPSFDNADKFESFASSVGTYKEALAKLSASTTTNRDLVVGPEFNKSKDALAKYGESIEANFKGVRAYFSLLNACGTAQTTKSAKTQMASDACGKYLDLAKNTPSSGFSNNFLKSYTLQVSNVIDSLDSTSLSGNITKLQEFYKKTHVDYSLDANPTSTLNNLLSLLESQKSSMIR